jgi:hypothetical protein
MSKKSIDNELEKLILVGENGNGFGDPDAEKAHNRKIQLLMHKQILNIKKKNNFITILSLFVDILSTGILVYQEFIK